MIASGILGLMIARQRPGEEALNGRVYALFGLTAAEINIVEAQTKYRYGEV